MLAVGTVQSKPLSVQIPVNREKSRLDASHQESFLDKSLG